MVVITHDRISGNVNSEDRGNFEQAFLSPATSVLETATAMVVFATEKSAAYAVVIRGGIKGYLGVLWSGHGALHSDRFG